MATVVVQQQQIRHSDTPPPTLAPPIALNASTSNATSVPNKHIPVCPAGRGAADPDTPPSSPPGPQLIVPTTSLLYPTSSFTRLCNAPPIFSINADRLAEALNHLASQPLPDPKTVFPWLHGLHGENQIQLAFFVARRKSLRKTPKVLRSITLIKAGGDLSRCKLKGAISPDEILPLTKACSSGFVDPDPREGFSVRNFQIQAAKMATVSDIVIYGDETVERSSLNALAGKIATAQRTWQKKMDPSGPDSQAHNTFVLSTPFSRIEQDHPELIALDSRGQITEHAMDFFQRERMEMCAMSKASEISKNVFMGPTPDWSLFSSGSVPEEQRFDIYIEANDMAQIPDRKTLIEASRAAATQGPQRVEVPSSGSLLPPSWNNSEVDAILDILQWLYKITNSRCEDSDDDDEDTAARDEDGDTAMTSGDRPLRVLLHCADGYTENTVMGIAYFMFAEGVPVHDAWLKLHCHKNRNFFAYHSDVAFLTAIQPRILSESPTAGPQCLSRLDQPGWLSRMDGSLPSRILPYMYLGNLTHANNPELLRAMGIKRILSIGEPVKWTKKDHEDWGAENLLMINKVQDNGIDPLTQEFDRCLAFIGQSATIDILQVVLLTHSRTRQV